MQTSQTNIIFVFGSESLNNALIFTGKEWEQETGTYYFGARRYDPTIGQWLGRDPAGQFESPYVYAGNGVNPLTSFDPDGNKDMRIALYYNAEPGPQGKNIPFDATEYAKQYKSYLVSKMPDDVIYVKAFAVGKFMEMQSWLNTGGDNDNILRGIITHGGQNKNYITDLPYSEFQNRVSFSNLNRFLYPTFISACWANSNINQSEFPNLLKPEQDGVLNVNLVLFDFLWLNSDTYSNTQTPVVETSTQSSEN